LPWLLWGVSACSNILGISGYEIDPSLDQPSGGSGVILSGGAPTEAGASGAGEGGAPAGDGGAAAAGASPAAGAAGEPPVVNGCQSDDECDDTIDCTQDSCLPDGTCEHLADSDRCDASNCESCLLGIGCVAGPKHLQQLLGDPQFDSGGNHWKEDGGPLILSDSRALSSPNLVQFGPAAPDATETLYGDVYQSLRIPAGTAALSLTLNYRFAPSDREPPDDEYAVAALYLHNATTPFTQFHSFPGTDPAQPTWKQVTYKAPPDDVARMVGKDFTFDLVAHAFGGEYWFDDLQLDATICE
jgi:hypothetical protein